MKTEILTDSNKRRIWVKRDKYEQLEIIELIFVSDNCTIDTRISLDKEAEEDLRRLLELKYSQKE